MLVKKRSRVVMTDISTDSSFFSCENIVHKAIKSLFVSFTAKSTDSTDHCSAKSPRSPGFDRVGLSLVDSLNNDEVLGSSVLFGSQMIRTHQVPSPKPSNGNEIIIASLSASEIELSEDYTCIISHGPNPKTTHIFGDLVLASDQIQALDCKNSKSEDFLGNCFGCKKKLEQGEDVFMYRERTFCSANCRDQEILLEEEKSDHRE